MATEKPGRPIYRQGAKENSLRRRARRATASGRLLLPGLFATFIVAAGASFLADHYQAPVMLFALLLGMALGFLHEEGRAVPGIDFTATVVLRLGVALLGLRITLDEVTALGAGPVLLVIAAVVLTLLFGILCSTLLGRGRHFGLLSGGSVGICGASAALALAAVLPRNDRSERDTIFAVISVTALSTLAMIAYPLVANRLGLSDSEAGLFLGGTIHDVAQVVGAAYSMSPATGDAATVVKVLRVAMLVPTIFVLSVIYRRGRSSSASSSSAIPLPLFIVAFAVLVAVNSMGVVPSPLRDHLVATSQWCLVAAIAALGMKTSLRELATVGWRPLSIVIAETAFLAVVVLVGIRWLAAGGPEWLLPV
ncbi:YeiH family protein [Pseudohaliea rubra]|uniref:Inner membrane protein n=1 Tax=Pseudohaliea rubra DSM 19751 TaxID=1265313 RepID=A0A095XSK6_9GAMM|nr:putative sulfate exporter family transporter [Pseudohaliea rubra]KGE02641.1 Inner membrane protein [Pseudohaliea rubra DSM 19751]